MAVTDIGNSNLVISNVPLGIQVTKVTDTSADWSSVANSTYFYDKADGLVHFKNSGGTVLELFSASGGLTYFTEAQSTASPNNLANVDSLTAVASTTSADFVIRPKNSGAILSQIPDGTLTGGDKRGGNAIDFQKLRAVATQVASGSRSVIINGANNTASSSYSTVVNGVSNTASNSYDIVVTGFGSSASGYSGYSTVVNGRFNSASGYYGYATVLNGSVNIASGSLSTILNGCVNTASGTYSSIVNGSLNIASGSRSTILNGCSNTASAIYSTVLNGKGNTASGCYSTASGGYASTQSITGRISHASGRFSANGDAQISTFVLRVSTASNVATTLTANGSTASATNQIILANQTGYRFKGTIIGKQSGSTNVASWDIDGLIVRGANAGTTTVNVSNVNVVQNTPAWGTPTLSADTVNGGLQVQVTGAVATNIQWVSTIETTEVIYA